MGTISVSQSNMNRAEVDLSEDRILILASVIRVYGGQRWYTQAAYSSSIATANGNTSVTILQDGYIISGMQSGSVNKTGFVTAGTTISMSGLGGSQPGDTQYLNVVFWKKNA